MVKEFELAHSRSFLWRGLNTKSHTRKSCFDQFKEREVLTYFLLKH